MILPRAEEYNTVAHRPKARPHNPDQWLSMSCSVRPRPCRSTIRCNKTVIRQTPRVQRPPVQAYCRDSTRRHVGAVLARWPSIDRRIAANSGQRHHHLRQLQRNIPTMADHLSIYLHRFLPQCGQRPVLYLLWQSQRPHEAGEIVSRGVKLQPDSVVAASGLRPLRARAGLSLFVVFRY